MNYQLMNIEGGTISIGAAMSPSGAGVSIGAPSISASAMGLSFGAGIEMGPTFGGNLSSLVPSFESVGPSLLNPLGVESISNPFSTSPHSIWNSPDLHYINEGPVSTLDFESLSKQVTAPDIFPSRGEIIFNTQTEPILKSIGVNSVIQEAEQIASEAWQKTEISAIKPDEEPFIPIYEIDYLAIPQAKRQIQIGYAQPLVSPATGDEEEEDFYPILNPLRAEATKVKVKSKPDSAQEEGLVTPYPMPKPDAFKIEQAEAVAILENQKEPQGEEGEKTIESRQRYLKDENAEEERLTQLRVAIRKASEEAEAVGLRAFSAEMVRKYMPHEVEDEGLTSEDLKKNYPTKDRMPDGSYEATLETFGLLGEFESQQQAFERGRMVVEANRPIRWGENGKPVVAEDVKVYRKHTVKPSFMGIVEKRVIKKTSNSKP